MKFKDIHDDIENNINTGRRAAVLQRIKAIRSQSSTAVKICGITALSEVELLNELKPDFTGFIQYFPKSCRNIDPDTAKALKSRLDPDIMTVAVTVSPSLEQVQAIEAAGFDLIQIHGELPESLFEKTGIPVIRAINIKSMASNEKFDISVIKEELENPQIAGLLFDAASPGSGTSFDWDQLNDILKGITTDKLIFLAGGLDPQNVTDAIAIVHPDVADVSSGVENDLKSPGRQGSEEKAIDSAAGTKNGSPRGKDPEKVRSFISAVRNI
ncbi:MAG: phosphoribosylanthranilate isomerase [Lachnospiraceae bacterium]|jgi:phosphoribosylanthranilate isomerase|nr:phosphoribosylanthranilate isomerase [Lachnospiraceae bacterium]